MKKTTTKKKKENYRKNYGLEQKKNKKEKSITEVYRDFVFFLGICYLSFEILSFSFLPFLTFNTFPLRREYREVE